MKTIAVASLKGGVGKTTTAANLGAALARRERGGVLLVDLDPRNQLGMHIGLATDGAGLAEASIRGVSWERVVQRSLDDVSCLPFGAHRDGLAAELDALLARRPDLLGDSLAEQSLQANRLVVLDTAPWPSPLFDQALALADLVLVVLLADAASFATLPMLRSLISRRRRGDAARTLVLLNCVDASRLGRDVRALVAAQPQLPLLPIVIHRDAAVPEALALQRPVIAASPSSQAADDFDGVAEWLLRSLGADSEARLPSASRREAIAVTDLSSAHGVSR